MPARGRTSKMEGTEKRWWIIIGHDIEPCLISILKILLLLLNKILNQWKA